MRSVLPEEQSEVCTVWNPKSSSIRVKDLREGCLWTYQLTEEMKKKLQ